jgi:hypothetical protein
VKIVIKSLFLFFICLACLGSGDHDGEHHDDKHHHGAGKAIGPGKAIEEVKEGEGFKLGVKAFELLKVELLKIKSHTFLIPKVALVRQKNETGLYRYKNGYFLLFQVSVVQEKSEWLKVYSEGLKEGDLIVKSKANLLRVADIYSTDKSEYGHGH